MKDETELLLPKEDQFDINLNMMKVDEYPTVKGINLPFKKETQESKAIQLNRKNSIQLNKKEIGR